MGMPCLSFKMVFWLRPLFAAHASAGILTIVGCGGSELDVGRTDAGAATDAGTSMLTTWVFCKDDQTCNYDRSMSGLAGACVQGRCQCKPGFGLAHGGTCRPGKGIGEPCERLDDCIDGLACSELEARSAAGVCSLRERRCGAGCTIGRSGEHSCDMDFGPGLVCIEGCEPGYGVCTTPR